MKTKNFWQFILFLIFGVVFQLSAQETKVPGNWGGKLYLPTSKLEMIFKITADESGKLISKLDVPAQGAMDLQVADTKVISDSLYLNVAMIFGKYEGKFTSDSTIDGQWKQNGMTFPLTLNKSKITLLRRPQTPVPPFPYLSEEVEYMNPVSGLKLSGTLTTPENAMNCPAVILISGSGSQDRDETIFEHKPFLVIADFLTRNGIAVLRVDDRGVGGSEGKTSDATSEDFAEDVLAGIDYLKTRKETNPTKIGLIGHSEGGLIAPMVATKTNDVAFVIMLAGPGIVGEQILYEQGKLINKAAGLTDEQVQQNQKMQEAVFNVLKTEVDSAIRTSRLQRIMSNGMYNTLNDEMKATVDKQVKTMDNKWFRFFLEYDPYPALMKLQCPVLAINGEKDLQVPPNENLAAIEKALTEGGNKNFKTIEIPGLNHLFQTCETGAIAEYAQIEETISPVVLEILVNWILNYGIKN